MQLLEIQKYYVSPRSVEFRTKIKHSLPIANKKTKKQQQQLESNRQQNVFKEGSVLSTTILSPSTLLRILEAVLDLAVSSIHPAKNKPARCTCAVPHALGSSNYGMGRYVAVVDIGKGLNNLFPTRGLPTIVF